MYKILYESNLDLLSEIEQLIAALTTEPAIPELMAYHEHLVLACEELRDQIRNNLKDLKLGRNETLPDILSETQRLVRELRLYNQRLAGPVLRARKSDRLSLRVISWLHSIHRETQGIPAAVSTDEFGIWPAPPHPVIYFMPASTQQGLLYQPLFFHEFGHLLYACHKPEMDSLVKDLQIQIAELLQPLSHRQDTQSQFEVQQNAIIVLTWYNWAQELFCDAVGLTIGGPAFLHAFNRYLRTGPRTEFHCPPEKLRFSSHPVSWLRLHLLVRRAKQLGFEDTANELERQWETIAATLNLVEDYYGFFEDTYLSALWQTLEDMLIEADPYYFTEQDLSEQEWTPDSTVVHLINYAWLRFEKNKDNFAPWEDQAIATFLSVPSQ